MMNENRRYTEVSLDGQADSRDGRNPKARQFRYEYALYEVVSGLFKDVICRSTKCIETLGLYFKELPYGSAYANAGERADANEEANSEKNTEQKKKKTQNDIIEEVTALVERHVTGKITFPMMHACLACVVVKVMPDGSHEFTFTDGIYGFTVSIKKPGKDGGMRINVQNLSPVLQEAEITEYRSSGNTGRISYRSGRSCAA